MLKRKKGDRTDYDVNSRNVALRSDEIGPVWQGIMPENLKLSEGRRYDSREVKAFALQDAGRQKQAQLLIVIFNYNDVVTAKDAYIEIGEGLESEMPKDPRVGDESTIFELDMRPMVKMKICAFRKGTWLTIFTIWMFQDFDLDDSWVRDIMMKQCSKLG